MSDFWGRERELGILQRVLAEVAQSGRGRALLVTGRRRVGKSRLIQRFVDANPATPSLVFQATRGRDPNAERHDLLLEAQRLPGADRIAGLTATDWNGALRTVAAALSDEPAIIVLDEVPWLVEADAEFEGALQTVWDQLLSAKPVLLLLLGSDLSVMESLQTYGRPFFGRATPMRVSPLSAADIADHVGLGASDAIDAHLITGGYPEIVSHWGAGVTRAQFLASQLADPLSPLLMAGELTMLGEFPDRSRSRAILTAIGSGDSTFSAIAASGGGTPLPAGTLAPLLTMLADKGVIAIDEPLSTKPSTRLRRYRISDSYLRFWLRFLDRGIQLVERGRGDLLAARIERDWFGWRGTAIEPVVRSSLERLLPSEQWPQVGVVGGWWNRSHTPEIDLVGADRAPARHISFVGSIKWREQRPFDADDYAQLRRDAVMIPGVSEETSLVAVSRSGCSVGLPIAQCWGPEDLVDAWR